MDNGSTTIYRKSEYEIQKERKRAIVTHIMSFIFSNNSTTSICAHGNIFSTSWCTTLNIIYVCRVRVDGDSS